jgi:hypothetical protein
MSELDLTEGEPLVATEAEALALPGRLVRHHKGGIYRVMGRGDYAPAGDFPLDEVVSVRISLGLHAETLRPVEIRIVDDVQMGGLWVLPLEPHRPDPGDTDPVVIYEHIWPDPHRFWVRSEPIFDSPTDTGVDRFVPVR